MPPQFSGSTQSQTLWVRLLLLLGGLYLLHACYAVSLHRHLYGDASWFLVRMISEGKPTNFYTDFAHQFYYSRVVAYWLTQLPTVIGIHAGIASVNLLSYVFGATYFGHKLISLVVCYVLLGKNEKHLFAFPLLGLFAGTIISDVYIVTEIHISTSFLWPIAILLFRDRPLVGKTYGFTTCAILLAAFTYESWAFLAPMLLGGLLVRRIASKRAQRLPVAPTLALVLCAIINWCAILFPRDPANKDGFVKGTLHILTHTFAGVAHWHIGAMAAVLAALCVLLLIVLPARFKRPWLWMPVACIAMTLALVPPLHFYLVGVAVDLSYAVTDRGFAGLVMQAGLLALFLGARLVWRPSTATFYYVAALLCGLGAGQVAWQMMATRSWHAAAHASQSIVNDERGPVPCEKMDSWRGPANGPSPSNIMCTWWVTPFSLLQNPDRQVRTLITTNSAFQAFDVVDPDALPGKSDGAFNYRAYLDALGQGGGVEMSGTVDFGTDGRGVPMLRQGFSHTEAGQTWTDGQTAVVHLCLPSDSSTDTYRIDFTVVPHLDRQHLPLSVSIRPGAGRPTTWAFEPTNPPLVSKSIDVQRSDFKGSNCGDLHFNFASMPPSPAQLGESNDDRHLGLAFIKATIQAL